jgi:hypothetical protein
VCVCVCVCARVLVLYMCVYVYVCARVCICVCMCVCTVVFDMSKGDWVGTCVRTADVGPCPSSVASPKKLKMKSTNPRVPMLRVFV